MAKDFVVEEKSEPPKFYTDSLERTRIVEFVTHKTVIRKTGEQNERN